MNFLSRCEAKSHSSSFVDFQLPHIPFRIKTAPLERYFPLGAVLLRYRSGMTGQYPYGYEENSKKAPAGCISLQGRYPPPQD